MSSFNLLTLLVGFPETKYKREVASTAAPLATSSSSNSEKHQETGLESPKEDIQVATTPKTAEEQDAGMVGRGRPARGQFALWHAPDASWKSHILHDLLTPFRIAIYPIILWTSFVVGGTININLFFVLTEDTVLSEEPYHWEPSSVGYANFASYVFSLLSFHQVRFMRENTRQVVHSETLLRTRVHLA